MTAPLPCPACGYDLRGLAASDGALCPECGTRSTWRELFDPRELPTPRPWIVALYLTPAVVVATGIAALFAQVRPDPFAAANAGLGAGFLWAFYFAARRQFPSLPARARFWPRLCAAASGAGHATVITLVCLVPAALFIVATI